MYSENRLTTYTLPVRRPQCFWALQSNKNIYYIWGLNPRPEIKGLFRHRSKAPPPPAHDASSSPDVWWWSLRRRIYLTGKYIYRYWPTSVPCDCLSRFICHRSKATLTKSHCHGMQPGNSALGSVWPRREAASGRQACICLSTHIQGCKPQIAINNGGPCWRGRKLTFLPALTIRAAQFSGCCRTSAGCYHDHFSCHTWTI